MSVVEEDQTKTFREFFKTYNRMSEQCFNQCVWDFGTNSMRNREVRCVMNCVGHYLAANKEIGRIFAEDQANLIVSGSVQKDV